MLSPPSSDWLLTFDIRIPLPHNSYDDKDLLPNRPLLQQALVISAGVIANVLLAFVLMNIAAVAGPPRPKFIIKQVENDSPAAQAGIQPEDLILAVRFRLLGGGGIGA